MQTAFYCLRVVSLGVHNCKPSVPKMFERQLRTNAFQLQSVDQLSEPLHDDNNVLNVGPTFEMWPEDVNTNSFHRSKRGE